MGDLDVSLLLLLLTPVYFVAIAAEWVWHRQYPNKATSNQYNWPDFLANVALGLFYQAGEKLSGVVVMAIYHNLFSFRLFDIPVTPWSLLLLVLLQDALYYSFHRASHNVCWLWASHVVHHSSRHLNLATAFRQSLMYPLSGMWLFWLPLIILGFPPEAVITVVLLNLFYQFFIHCPLVPKLGWLEGLLNTPRHHRVHHACNGAYIDRNFGGILIIWDRLFGTFVEEQPDQACRYGFPRNVNSHNPLTLTFHEWRAMFKDICAPGRTPGQRLRHMLGYPGWQPPAAGKEPAVIMTDKIAQVPAHGATGRKKT